MDGNGGLHYDRYMYFNFFSSAPADGLLQITFGFGPIQPLIGVVRPLLNSLVKSFAHCLFLGSNNGNDVNDPPFLPFIMSAVRQNYLSFVTIYALSYLPSSSQDTPYEVNDHTHSHEAEYFESLFNGLGDVHDLDNFDPFAPFPTLSSLQTYFSPEYPTTPVYEPKVASGYITPQLLVTT